MIIRLIAETLTPIVSKSRFLRVRGVRGIVSNQPYLELEAPARYGCHTTLIVKQGVHGFPLQRRAHMGYFHLDFKAHTTKRARGKVNEFLQIQEVGQFTTWGYGALRWILQKTYHTKKPARPWGQRFRILKGLPPKLTTRERQLVMAALLHDLVDTTLHPSKLGHSLSILDPFVQWLCVQHHSLKEYPPHPDLQLLQAADVRQSRYARVLALPTRRRKMGPVNTHQLARQLEQAAQHSVYQLYSVVNHSQDLNSLTASKTHPTETLRHHMIGVANWTLFWLRTRSIHHSAASVALVGESGATPDPVEMEDPRDTMNY